MVRGDGIGMYPFMHWKYHKSMMVTLMMLIMTMIKMMVLMKMILVVRMRTWHLLLTKLSPSSVGWQTDIGRCEQSSPVLKQTQKLTMTTT